MTATVTPIGRAPDPAAHTGTTTAPRLEALIASERAIGYLRGERAGYVQGSRRGAACWLLAGLVGGILLRHLLGPLT